MRKFADCCTASIEVGRAERRQVQMERLEVKNGVVEVGLGD